MFGEVADGAVGGEVVEGGEGDVVFGGEGGEGEVGVEDAGGHVVFAGGERLARVGRGGLLGEAQRGGGSVGGG